METVITPPKLHINWDVLFRAGKLAIITVGAPGVHGAAVTGVQGIGVNTPRAAVVAAATAGLLGEEHMPKGMIFMNGMLSMIFAAGILLVMTMFFGNTFSDEGATPNVHASSAP